MSVNAMVLAAGEGTRLRPLSLDVPKPMLSVAGRATLEWIFAWLRFHGFCELAVNLCHRPKPVMDHFGDGAAVGVHLVYSVEEQMLGTGGGVKRVAHLFHDSLVVVYGDVLTDLDLGTLMSFHKSRGPEPHVTLSVYRAEKPWDCGVVAMQTDGRVTKFVEKPPRDQVFSEWTNSGVLILDPQILEHIPPVVPYDLSSDLIPKLLDLRVPVHAKPLEADEYLIDMGTLEKYERAQREWPTAKARRYLDGKD